MVNIGIERYQGLIYEGDLNYGRPVWPTPVITPAKFIFTDKEEIIAHESSSIFGYRFREDSFDPISRIRRGRFYHADEAQPKQWRVSNHPGSPWDSIAADIHGRNKALDTFNSSPIWQKYINSNKKPPLVLLGTDYRFTAWTIVSFEAISTGEDLITLKARSSLGILPEIKQDNVPVNFQTKLNETLDTFVDEVHRSSPVSVIDRARDVVTHALLAYFNLNGQNAQDLGKLIKKLEEKKMIIAANVANIIARLHARAKPSEQEKYKLYAIREQDAELAIQCVGILLCEIKFAE